MLFFLFSVMTYEEYFGDWTKVIDYNELTKVLKKVNIEYNTKSIMPRYEDIFKAFTLCSLHDTKIIMVGQDPYPQRGVATGILFANYKDVSEEDLSPSLKIIKEAVIDFAVPHNIITFDNSLESWCKQGILMLNSALTVELNRVGSHAMLWRKFICSLLTNICKYETGLIFVLFGQQAQTFSPYINSRYNTIIKEKHPAWYARTGNKMPHSLFTTISNMCMDKYGIPIKWYEEEHF